MSALFSFETEVERDDRTIRIEVEYGVSADELFINGITPDLETSDEENRQLIAECNAHFAGNRR